MKMKKIMKKVVVLFVTLALVTSAFSACAKSKKTEETNEPAVTTQPTEAATKASAVEAIGKKFPITVKNDNASIEGGVLKVAMVTDSANAGVLNPCFYEDAYDSEVLIWFTESILSFDDNFVADQDGAATYEYDKDAKTITLKMKDGVKWHDGEQVTLDDLLFAYEVLCNKDYEGTRYDDSFLNIEGVEEYHSGKVDTISGLKLSEDKMTLIIQFKEFYPSILVGGFWTSPISRHYFEGIAIKDMAASEKSRKTPIGFGPFKVKNVVPGESVEFERFDDYWQGKPKLDGVIVSVCKMDLAPSAMEEGKFDIAQFSSQQYPDYTAPTNYQYVGQLETVFNYTGFKLGKWDAEQEKDIYDPNCKMANINLRQAIGYAMDNDTIGKELYNGLRVLATTIITPRHKAYQDATLAGYNYDPEKAKQLLDDAGYKDVDGDGYREDPNGKKFTITWATMDGEGADTFAQFKIQCWKAVGLNVELYNGRPTEFNAFYDAVEKDDPAIDMYDAAWDTGYDPNPNALWGPETTNNMTRYTSDSLTSIIKEISSEKAWDSAFLTQKYKEWQEAFFTEAPAIPTLWRVQLTAVNNRVKNYDLTAYDIKQTYHLIELTANDTIKK